MSIRAVISSEQITRKRHRRAGSPCFAIEPRLCPREHAVQRPSLTLEPHQLLIEGAWTYRMPARVSRKLHDRNEKLSPTIRDIAWKARLRLCSRYRRLAAAGKAKVVVTTAIAREMVGFIWAIARITRPALSI
jgi:hypothetical protein